MKVMAIANHKGGCGKTTTAINLSACLAARGREVILLDFDPQGHATVGLTTGPAGSTRTLSDALAGRASLPEVLRPVLPGLRLAPSGSSWARAERTLRSRPGQERAVGALLDGLMDRVDYVLIDCPPSAGPLTDSAVWAADTVILTVEASFFALHGVGQMISRIQEIDRLKPRPTRIRALATLYDRRTRFAREILTDLNAFFGRTLYDTVIRSSVQLRECTSHGLPVTAYGRRTRGYEDYMGLAVEVDEDAAAYDGERSIALESDHAVGTALR
jgi:chromosome partitioning protein